MDTFNEDPKPGRLVLPLVLVGMIATTYTFINRVATDNNLDIEPSVEQVADEPDQEAKDEFANFIEDAQQFVETVSQPGPPSTFAGLIKSHEELKSLADLIYADTEELLEGLTSSDTGERRSTALDSFNNNINLFQAKVDEIVAINTSG